MEGQQHEMENEGIDRSPGTNSHFRHFNALSLPSSCSVFLFFSFYIYIFIYIISFPGMGLSSHSPPIYPAVAFLSHYPFIWPLNSIFPLYSSLQWSISLCLPHHHHRHHSSFYSSSLSLPQRCSLCGIPCPALVLKLWECMQYVLFYVKPHVILLVV